MSPVSDPQPGPDWIVYVVLGAPTVIVALLVLYLLVMALGYLWTDR